MGFSTVTAESAAHVPVQSPMLLTNKRKKTVPMVVIEVNPIETYTHSEPASEPVSVDTHTEPEYEILFTDAVEEDPEPVVEVEEPEPVVETEEPEPVVEAEEPEPVVEAEE
jgi:hypothetical protein